MGRASKDKRDIYYRKAKEEGYRARSAYKLLQLHEEFDILRPENIKTGVVDLCAAPGSWSQVLVHFLHASSTSPSSPTAGSITAAPRIVAVDLQEMMPIEGVSLLQGDITSEATARDIIHLLNADNDNRTTAAEMVGENWQTSTIPPDNASTIVHNNGNNNGNNTNNVNARGYERKADLVVCDGAPDVTGMHELDEYLQHHLLLAALNLTTFVLRHGGTFVTKIFRGPNTPFLVAKAEVFFQHVMIAKPKSSRNTSMEAFLVCQCYDPPAGYSPSFEHPFTATTPCFIPAAPLPSSLQQSSISTTAATTTRTITEESKSEEMHGGGVEAAMSVVVPFLACGDLSGYDADMCYDRDMHVPILPPVHPPLQAPYMADTSATTTRGENVGVDEGKRRRLECEN